MADKSPGVVGKSQAVLTTQSAMASHHTRATHSVRTLQCEVVAHIAWEKTLNLQRPLRRSRYTPTTVPRIRAVGEWRINGMGV